MKPFDLEKARAGAACVTRDGRRVRIVCFDYKHPRDPIVALLQNGDFEYLQTYGPNGKVFSEQDSDGDLFMAPVKRELWINVFRNQAGTYRPGDGFYSTAEEAMERLRANDWIGAYAIEIEE